LALAQAAAYMTETGTSFNTYTRLYKEQWPLLMEMHDDRHMPLRNYANGSVATTWTISFKAIQHRNRAAANLLLLWAHLDNKNLWHGLLAEALQWSDVAAKRTAEWLGKMAHSEVDFINAINILRSYSLVEEAEGQAGYATHPVVHQWAFYMQDDSQRTALSWLAVVLVGLAVPSNYDKHYWERQSRLLPHAEQCETYVMTKDLANREVVWRADGEEDSTSTLLRALCCLGDLYRHQLKINKAEKMYKFVTGNDQNLSKQSNDYDHRAALNLSSVYRKQGKLSEAKELLLKTLEFDKRVFGEDARQTLWTICAISKLYNEQGKFDKAEEMIMQAFIGFKKTLGEDHLETLDSLQDLSRVYFNQGKFKKAEEILLQVLESKRKTLPDYSPMVLAAMIELGDIYFAQGKFRQAREILTQAMEECEKIVGSENILTCEPALLVMWYLGLLYYRLNSLDEAKGWYLKALSGYEKLFGEEHEHCQTLRDNLTLLDIQEGDSNSDSLYKSSNSCWSTGGDDLDGLDEDNNASNQTTPAQGQSHQAPTVSTQKPSSVWNVGFRHAVLNSRESCQSSTSVALDDQFGDPLD
jgi:tetratricopeptide (TPR) repeat protein